MKKIILFLPSNFPNNKYYFFFINKIYKFGIDMIEIGIPYIDSIADGDLVTKSYKYVKKKFNINILFNNIYNFNFLNKINNKIIMSYYNPIFKFNIKNFSYILNILKLDSVLIIDYNLECEILLYNLLKKKNINFIFFLSSNISKSKNIFLNKYFLNYNYFSYIKGITGDKKILYFKYLKNYLIKINKFIFGFGLSNIKYIIFYKYINKFVFGSFIIYLINKYYLNYKKIFKIIKIISFIIKNL